MNYKSYTLHNFRQIPQMARLTEEQKFSIETVGTVLPFKASSYVVDELIDWDNFENDPFFILNFPQREMLSAQRFQRVAELLKQQAPKTVLQEEVEKIRLELNPNPAGQQQNMPFFEGQQLRGIQHKYDETVLFFPSQGQTCHAYCTFCFRWTQFALNEFKFAMKESDLLVKYLQSQPQVTDVLFTGGDPMVMKTKIFEHYFNALLDADIPHLRNIRIGTKSLAYWPYRFTRDADADDLLRLFERTRKRGVNVVLMAHFNHPRSLQTAAAREAVSRLLSAGVQIRSQSPLLKHINDRSEIWVENWQEQVSQGIVPYYMFIARNTGAQDYFAVPLERAWQIFRSAFSSVSGICRTVKGPSMSTNVGKIRILGVIERNGEKHFALDFLQGREADWVGRPFFARYNPTAVWIDDLQPVPEEPHFFYEEDLTSMTA